MQSIPPRKHDSVVRVRLVLLLGMVDAVHSRRDQKLIQTTFETDRQSQVAVMKKRVGLKHDLVGGECSRGDSDCSNLDDAKGGRHCNLAKVKPKTRRNIQIRVNVVNVVESPEKGNAVVRDVPPVKRQVHPKKADDELGNGWKMKRVDEAKGLFGAPVQRTQGGWTNGNGRDEKRKRGHRQVDEQTDEHWTMPAAQRKRSLQKEQQTENAADDRECPNSWSH